jgi:hypothetical protein
MEEHHQGKAASNVSVPFGEGELIVEATLAGKVRSRGCLELLSRECPCVVVGALLHRPGS